MDDGKECMYAQYPLEYVLNTYLFSNDIIRSILLRRTVVYAR
jgi:hypothetical protein